MILPPFPKDLPIVHFTNIRVRLYLLVPFKNCTTVFANLEMGPKKEESGRFFWDGRSLLFRKA